MIIRLMAEQIAGHWEAIEQAIEQSLPPITYGSPERMKNIYESLMVGRMQCWVAFRGKREAAKVMGFCITTITEDYCSGVKNLLIYSVYACMPLADNEVWLRGYDTLCKFAKGNGCQRLVGYTNVPRLIHLVEAGFSGKGHADYTFITIDLD